MVITVKKENTHTEYKASTRNKQLAEAFYLTKDIEKYGSGFFRIRSEIADYPTMRFSYRNAGYGFITELSYTVQKTSIKQTVDAKDGIKVGETDRKDRDIVENAGINKNQQEILSAIKANPHITITELSKIIGINTTGIEKSLTQLKNAGFIKRNGARRNGYWQIVESY